MISPILMGAAGLGLALMPRILGVRPLALADIPQGGRIKATVTWKNTGTLTADFDIILAYFSRKTGDVLSHTVTEYGVTPGTQKTTIVYRDVLSDELLGTCSVYVWIADRDTQTRLAEWVGEINIVSGAAASFIGVTIEKG